MDYKCNSCKYLWTSRKSFGSPARCPSCNSKNISWAGSGWGSASGTLVSRPVVEKNRENLPCLVCKKAFSSYSFQIALWVNYQNIGAFCPSCAKDITSNPEKDSVLSRLQQAVPIVTSLFNDFKLKGVDSFPVLLEAENGVFPRLFFSFDQSENKHN